MSGRQVRRFVDDLLRERPARGFHPDDTDAAELRAAIELRAARPGAGEVREEFRADLHRRLAAQMRGDVGADATPIPSGTRRQVVVGGSIAAAAAALAVVVDRALPRGGVTASDQAAMLVPSDGSWRAVAAVGEVPEGAVRPFDLGSVTGFVHRVDGRLRAVSGICTHQGCRLWFDAPTDELRCPCHATAFAVSGQVLNHQLPVAPAPLPGIEVREHDGAVEVFVPTEPA